MTDEPVLFDLRPQPPRDGVIRTAVISEDGVYRYALTRVWDRALPVIAWVGLNPSTADAVVDDPTIRREIDFSKRWGFGGLVMLNLFAARSTDPERLREFDDPIGPANDAALWELTEGRTVVACWGASVPEYWLPRAAAIGHRLRAERDCFVLGVTQHGNPRHPLYVPAITPLQRWTTTRHTGGNP